MVKVPLSRRIRRGLFKWLYRRHERLRVFFPSFFVEYQHDDNISNSQSLNSKVYLLFKNLFKY